MWEFLPRAIGLQTFLLPPPSSIVAAMGHGVDTPLAFRPGRHAHEAIVGLAIGRPLGVLVAAFLRLAFAPRATR